MKLFASRLKVVSGVPNEADDMIVVHQRLRRAKKRSEMLRAWSPLAAQPSSANALRVDYVFSVENRTRRSKLSKVGSLGKTTKNQETRHGDRNSIPRCSGGSGQRCQERSVLVGPKNASGTKAAQKPSLHGFGRRICHA